MSSSREKTAPLVLRTFGAVRLRDESGREVADATPRTLALLAVLANAGSAGVSRDKLLVLFWPEWESPRARHALTQAVYSARQALRNENALIGSSHLHLDERVVQSDVAALRLAAEQGDDAKAASLYVGAFLDGFHLPSASSEFESWVEARRLELESFGTRALLRSAQRADAEGDHAAALRLWERLVELKPLDSGAVLGAMNALERSGDRSSALRLARTHERLLSTELGIEASRDVQLLRRKLEAPAPPVPAAVSQPALASVPLAQASAGEPVPVTTVRRRFFWRVITVAGATVAGVASYWFIGARDAAIRPLNERIVVAPFRVAGADSSLAFLRLGAIEMLMPRLGGDSGAAVPDRGALLALWRSTGIAGRASAQREVLTSIATRAGAQRLVTGSIVGTREDLRFSAELIELPSGRVAATVRAHGSLDSLGRLMDDLAVRVLLTEAGESTDSAHRRVLPAVRDYLAASAAIRRGAYQSGRSLLQRALAQDSSWGRAAVALVVAADMANDFSVSRRALRRVWRIRHTLSAADRRILSAFAGPAYPAPSSAAEQRVGSPGTELEFAL